MKKFVLFGLFFGALVNGQGLDLAARTDYELVAAGQSAQILGPNTATTIPGQVLERLIIVPETTGAGTVSIKDGADTAIDVFIAGTLPSLTPIHVPLGAKSKTGSWQVTTGANVHVIAVGRFR